MSRDSVISAVICLGWIGWCTGVSLGDLTAAPCQERLTDCPPVITTMAIDSQGHRLATGGDDHQIRIWDVSAGELVQTLSGHKDWVQGLVFSSDGRWLYSVGSDGMVARWKMEDGSLTPLGRQSTPLTSVALVPDRQQILTVGCDCSLRRIGWPGTKRALDCPSHDMRRVVASPRGNEFAAAGRDGQICVWSAIDGSLRQQMTAHDRRLRALAYSPDGARLVSAGEDRAICIWDPATGQELNHLDRAAGRILSLCVLSSERLAVGTSQNVIELWDFSSGHLVGSLKGHTGSVSALVHADEWLVSGGYDAQIRVWRVAANGEAVATRVLDVGPRSVRR